MRANGKKRTPVRSLRGFKERGWDRLSAGKEDGAALIEFAISAALVLSMLIGVFEMCLALYSYHFTADAAREASRWAMVRGSQCTTYSAGLDHCNAQPSDIQNYVQNLGYPGLSQNNVSVVSTWYSPSSPPNPTWSLCTSGTCNNPGNLVKVVVTYNFPLQIPFWKSGTLAVSSTSQMVVSQ
jgi:Flp pilus assembly protein TadG